MPRSCGALPGLEFVPGGRHDLAAKEAVRPVMEEGQGSQKDRRIDTTLYTDKKEGAEKLLERITAIDVKAEKPELVGKYREFPLKAGFNGFLQEYEVLLCGQREYKIKMGGDAAGNITRLNNALSKIPEYLTEEKAELQNLSAQIERGKSANKKSSRN